MPTASAGGHPLCESHECNYEVYATIIGELAEDVVTRSNAMPQQENHQGCNDPPITPRFRNKTFKL